jgi:hypothetical protein
VSEKTCHGSDGTGMRAPLRAFWVFYPDRPDTYGNEAWAAHGARELVQSLNEAYPFEHTLYNVAEIDHDRLDDPAVTDSRQDRPASAR